VTDLAVLEAEATAEEAGLNYISDAAPGIRRRRCGRGFAYRDPDGLPVDDRDRTRISKLVIPPAWNDVWISPDPRGHIQATGRDARGRKQYRYHDRWREVRDADKFSRLHGFGHALGDLRARIEDDLARTGSPRQRIVALVIRLLDETLIRVGNEEYATENASFGLTTLRPDHVDLDGSTIVLEFVGKGGKAHDVTIDDRRLARLVKRCHELGGQHLFSYRDRDGQIHGVSSSDVNEYLHDAVGPETSAKVFRTWGATSGVVGILAPAEPPPEDADQEKHILFAIDAAADRLGNTRTVCRQSYVHPVVLDAFRSGELHDSWMGSRSGARLTRADRTLLKVLEREA